MELLPTLKPSSTTFPPLDFANPPTKNSSPATEETDLTLSSSSPKNERCIEYEHWLWDAHARTEAFVASNGSETRLRGKILVKDLSDAISELDRLKLCDWERQRIEVSALADDLPAQPCRFFLLQVFEGISRLLV